MVDIALLPTFKVGKYHQLTVLTPFVGNKIHFNNLTLVEVHPFVHLCRHVSDIYFESACPANYNIEHVSCLLGHVHVSS